MNITSQLEIFGDSTAAIPFEQIASKKFVKNPQKYFLFPYSDNAYWIRIQIKNKDKDNRKWVLKWDNPLTEQLDYYVSDTSGRNFKHTQKKLLTSQKKNKFVQEEITLPFELAPHATKTIFLKLKNQRGLYGALVLHSADSYTESKIDTFSRNSFFNGLIIFRLFLVLILGLFIIKDFVFRVYSLQIVIRTIAFLSMMSVVGPIVSSDPDIAQRINFLGYNSFPIGSGILILAVLDLKRLPKWVPYIIYATIGFTILIDILVWFDYKWYWLKAGHYGIVFSGAFILLLYIYALLARITVKVYYSLPVILGVFSNLLINLRLFGLLEFKPIFSFTIFLFVAEIFLFAIFLGQIFINAEKRIKFNVVQNERLKELDTIKTTFFTNISHEFRTPLTLILSPLDGLVKKYPAETVFDPMKRNALRLLTLINQLLDLSKLDSGQMQVSIRQNDLAKFIQVLASSFSSLAESRGIQFEIIQNRKQAIAYYDADKIEKILINLLSNAFKFTQNQGKIMVSVNYTDEFSAVTIVVKDNGIGIASKKVGQIFDRFFQVDGTEQRGYEGTGIGLALVKEMVELHKGTINVESTQGQGTTFTIKLPIDKHTWQTEIVNTIPGEIKSEMPDFSYLVPVTQSFNTEDTLLAEEENILLIVEDNADLRQYIRSVFENDYQIIEAADGQEGIEKALTFVPDIVVSDWMMPRLDGLELCKLLKTDEKTSHIPVVMLTAKANIENRIEGLDLGADDYLTKPFNKEELQARVKNLVTQRALLRQKFDKAIVDMKPTEIKVASIDEKFIVKAKEIIEKNLSDSTFNIEQFAQEMAMTPVVLRRKIKALTNQTTTQFVRKYRLQKAANLLTNRADTVSNIAYQVGFENLSYFTRSFQEEFGQAPSEYGK
ncbi:hypothetical protein GCM10027442_47230 [Emticicia fontis]